MVDYKSCDNCKFDDTDEHEEPCARCRNTAVVCSNEYYERPFLWEPIEAAEAVDHPSHYNQGKYECIDVMVETFGKEATQSFCLLNAFKYVWRARSKNGVEDIKKARFYLDKFLELEGETNE